MVGIGEYILPDYIVSFISSKKLGIYENCFGKYALYSCLLFLESVLAEYVHLSN